MADAHDRLSLLLRAVLARGFLGASRRRARLLRALPVRLPSVSVLRVVLRLLRQPDRREPLMSICILRSKLHRMSLRCDSQRPKQKVRLRGRMKRIEGGEAGAVRARPNSAR